MLGVGATAWNPRGSSAQKVRESGEGCACSRRLSAGSRGDFINAHMAGVQCELDAWGDFTVQGPRGRHDHSMVWDAEGQSALIFGGQAGNSFEYFQDLWQYHWPSRAWSYLSASGPSTRPGPQSCLDAISCHASRPCPARIETTPSPAKAVGLLLCWHELLRKHVFGACFSAPHSEQMYTTSSEAGASRCQCSSKCMVTACQAGTFSGLGRHNSLDAPLRRSSPWDVFQ